MIVIIFRTEMIYYESIAENMPSWHNLPDPNDEDTWIQHFRILFYEKACFSYATLAEHEYTSQKLDEYIYFKLMSV